MMLDALIRARIADRGSISVAEYMDMALFHPECGYYMRKDPLGACGDFITAPEISQIFGELTGAWLAAQWHAMGRPRAALVELGPGRGTLMRDLLRAARRISGFHEAVSVHLVETSPALERVQRDTLSGMHPRIRWHDAFPDLAPTPLLMVANEFFDALPIRQFVGGVERRIGVDAQGRLAFIPQPAPRMEGQAAGIRETCEPACAIMRAIARHIVVYGGAALVADYGHAQAGGGDTLQAVKNHRYHAPLLEPGEADLTAHVDFTALAEAAKGEGARVYGPVEQGAFLLRLGAAHRAAKLCAGASEAQKSAILSGLERLISPDAMGRLFKVLAVTGQALPAPEGFQ